MRLRGGDPHTTLLISHWQCGETRCGASPTPQSKPFLFRKKKRFRDPKKKFESGSCGLPGVFGVGAGIVSSRAVEERLGSSTPLSRFWLCSHSFAPYCFLFRTVGRIFNDYYQSKRPSEVDAPDISIYHPTKLYTSTIKQTYQASSNHQAQ